MIMMSIMNVFVAKLLLIKGVDSKDNWEYMIIISSVTSFAARPLLINGVGSQGNRKIHDHP